MGAVTSPYSWDYRNRTISALVSGATTTYAYDHTVSRVRQTRTTTTTRYPSIHRAGLLVRSTLLPHIQHGSTIFW
jgi:hypothetical protein